MRYDIMKRAFTTYSSFLRKFIKETDVTAEEIVKLMRQGVGDEHEYLAWMQVEMEAKLLVGKGVHFFLTDVAFCDWLVDCVDGLKSDHISILQQEMGNDRVGVIHFPTNSARNSVAFETAKETWLPKFLQDGRITASDQRGPDYGTMVMSWSLGNREGLGSCVVTLDASAVCSEAARWYAKLIVGMAMYISCFPEMLKDGPPDDIKHPSYHNYDTSKTVGISEHVCTGESHSSPTAHFRRGHFRVLRSMRFTHKRFQAVFVRQTFVAGKAKTVLSPEQSCEVAV